MSATPPEATSDAPKPAVPAAPAAEAPQPAAPAPAPAAEAPKPAVAPAHGAEAKPEGELSAAQAAKAAAIAKAKAAQAAKAAAAAGGAPPAAKPAEAPPVAAAKPAPPPAAAAPVPAAAPAPKITIEINQKTLTTLVKAAGVLFGILTLLVLLFGGLSLFLLVRMGDHHPTGLVVKQIPGMDGNLEQIEKPVAAKDTGKKGSAPPKEGAAPEKKEDEPPVDDGEEIKIGETFKAFDGKPSERGGTWTTFRGAKYDNISVEAPLVDRWPAAGPKVHWTLDLGEGYAGAAVNQGRVYILDYDETTKEDALRCFSLEDGKEIWRRSYKVRVLRNHGMSRTVPAVTDKYVVTIGPRCHVMCVDALTGDLKWGIDLCKEYGTKVPLWYTAQCPLIDGDVAVIAPGGPGALMIGVDLETGKVKWKTENPKNWRMSHSSIVPMTLGGKKMYIYAAIGGIAGYAADGPTPGKILWESLEWAGIQVISPSPLIMEDGYVFMTTGYGAGSYLLKVTAEGDAFSAKTIWKLGVKDGLACEQQTPIYYDKKIYSMNPADSGARKDQLVCMDPYQNGKVLWSSGKEKRYGHYEPFMLADGKLFVLSEQGTLSIVKATPEKFEPISETKVLSGHDAWAPIALAGGRMILRDSKKMVCIDVSRGAE